MGLDLMYFDGQTPLSEDEKEGLIIPSISTRSELDEFEQQNIEEAILWSLKRKFSSTFFLQKTLYVNYTNGCMEMFGIGQENFVKQIKILEWINGKYQQI